MIFKALTANVEMNRGTDFRTDAIGHVACERPPVIAGHVDNAEGSVSIAQPYVATSCELSAAVQPDIRRERAVGDGA